MTVVSSVALEDLTGHAHWTKAAPGSLLQVRALQNNSLLVCMRCDLRIGAQSYPLLLALDGVDRGQLFAHEVVHPGALDVSSLLELRVTDPHPAPYSPAMYQSWGTVCELTPRSGRFVVRAAMPDRTGLFVWLADRTRKVAAGTASSEPLSDLFACGTLDVVEKPR